MGKTIQELTADLLAAPSACKEIKEAAQNYLDAVGKEGEAEALKLMLQSWKQTSCRSTG